MRSPQARRLFAFMVAAFVALGMPMAALGVAWPSVADDLGRSIADLGMLILVFGAGYTASTLVSGSLSHRFTTVPLLAGAAGAASVALVGYALTGSWGVFIVATLLLGVAGGLLDSGINSYVALRRGPRAMGVIHLGFGIGSVLGPLLLTATLQLGLSWRFGFALLAGFDLAIAAGFLVAAVRTERPARRTTKSVVDRPRGTGVVLVLSLLAFFGYAGVAAGTGQWSYSVLTESRGIGTTVAGVAVAAYWAGLTMARLVLSFIGDRIEPNRLLTGATLATVASLVVFWLSPTPALGIVGLALSGFAHGAFFPLEILLTARRFGAAYTPWAVGYEIAAANVGAALTGGLTGLLVGRVGLEVVPPLLVGIAVFLAVATELLRRSSGEVGAFTGLSTRDPVSNSGAA